MADEGTSPSFCRAEIEISAGCDNLSGNYLLSNSSAIGRRNYLFAGAATCGERAAAVYSLIGTALANKSLRRSVARPRSACPAAELAISMRPSSQ